MAAQRAPVGAPMPAIGAPRNAAYTERRAGRMNRTEARYGEQLAAEQGLGLVRWYEFEGITFRLPGGIRWTPDYPVLRPDGCLELHEVKGRRGSTYFATEKARLKLRLAADVLPFPIRVVWPDGAGGWAVEHRSVRGLLWPPAPRP